MDEHLESGKNGKRIHGLPTDLPQTPTHGEEDNNELGISGVQAQITKSQVQLTKEQEQRVENQKKISLQQTEIVFLKEHIQKLEVELKNLKTQHASDKIIKESAHGTDNINKTAEVLGTGTGLKTAEINEIIEERLKVTEGKMKQAAESHTLQIQELKAEIRQMSESHTRQMQEVRESVGQPARYEMRQQIPVLVSNTSGGDPFANMAPDFIVETAKSVLLAREEVHLSVLRHLNMDRTAEDLPTTSTTPSKRAATEGPTYRPRKKQRSILDGFV
ncbi:hypothetical protein FGRMN_7249 [Fusarium graminum]|nr:hypothetical protein FGRMN_7249 [Fusarium graminum]